MEVIERPRVPEERGGEARLERQTRLRAGFRESRLYGVRRLPRSFAGGFLCMIVLFLFWGGIAGWTLNFFIGFAVSVGFVVVAAWALVQAPIRPAFDQRWRPHRSIEPLDETSWRELAERLGARFVEGKLPRVEGAVGGIAFALFFEHHGGARTVATATLPFPVKARLIVYPRRAEYTTKDDFLTGDEKFDPAWHAISADPETAKRLLSPAARAWIAATEPEQVHAKGRVATARGKSFVTDSDRLYGLVMSVVEMGR